MTLLVSYLSVYHSTARYQSEPHLELGDVVGRLADVPELSLHGVAQFDVVPQDGSATIILRRIPRYRDVVVPHGHRPQVRRGPRLVCRQ